ncbi:GNAT family N-acetyltransferase [Streptomyces broussonetiae]|uniref:GNAT family N-acetyltransferase n=1 Tax=Streptomyces broussonetiae TaxID=2686304 RepID=A0A6I6MQT6_9ACTN|nr:GNAT family N-acetyltransferase [Streptomyces broussonetiae]QHA02693.1 GNAT family N-acetyltransferase [Streptomyces broussonetiae]
MTITCAWRGDFDDAALEALHADGFGHPAGPGGRRARLERHSLGRVRARQDGALVGFVNVARDGAGHAFVLDTVVARGHRGLGIGAGLVAAAAQGARAARCTWLHVDFEDHLGPFYLDACGFRRTAAGLLAL